MHSPSLAQGRWKLRAQPLSAHVMAAPLSPQTQHCFLFACLTLRAMAASGRTSIPGLALDVMLADVKQNSWTRIPVSKSVCPQMSGSTSAWPHSAHTGSSELEAFRFLSDMMCVNSEHCESPCSLHASPGRTDAQAEPGSYCCAPGFARHNGCTLTRTVTSRSPPDGGCGRGPLASRQEASRQFQATPQLLWATFEGFPPSSQCRSALFLSLLCITSSTPHSLHCSTPFSMAVRLPG